MSINDWKMQEEIQNESRRITDSNIYGSCLKAQKKEEKDQKLVDWIKSYYPNLSKEDIQIKWMTLSGSTEAKKSDQLGLANVKILKDGSLVNEKVISFVSKGVKTITDVIG